MFTKDHNQYQNIIVLNLKKVWLSVMSLVTIKKITYGIRIENLVYIKKNKNKLSFENLTLAPIEKDLINYNLLTRK